ncbi:ABC transporter ATP-binding protein [Bradyrhizobium sp. WSM 1738]|uniref:ABC transporter ATP-binding protein n=1 Tax=Bradyrhizobium hereditatis TaxID=2821405 RepID=UPI001CE39BC1|nr:ABC transporter ATP-binding protein [Bradyrhizobium hereditatis]MCA6119736.1 ABC transporter ATP-binding protein [Bradyrhizobium hereditatis]
MTKRKPQRKTAITKHKVADGIYLLRFKTQYELTSTFLRVQEHYESPQFHGRIFTLEQYMDWYVAENGAFTYFQDWSGFNVPSTALRPFYEGKFDPLTSKEKWLLGLFRNLRGRFYIIGIYEGGKKGTLTHEFAHALFFIDDAYREAVREAMRDYDTSALEKQLAKTGYARHVIPDEVQAYIVAPSGKLGAVSRPLIPLRRKLRMLFRQHAKGLSLPAR